MCCGSAAISCSLKNVILAECDSGKVDTASYLEDLTRAVRNIENWCLREIYA